MSLFVTSFGQGIAGEWLVLLVTIVTTVSAYFLIRMAFSVEQNRKKLRQFGWDNSFLEKALNHAGVGIWERDLHSGEMRFLSEAEKLLSIGQGEPRNYQTYLSKIHKDDRLLVNHKQSYAIGQTGSFHLQYRVLEEDGSVRWLEDQGMVVYNPQGYAQKMIGIVREITPIKKLESERHAFYSLLEKSNDFIALTSLEGQILYLNETGKKMIGLSGRESFSELSIHACFSPPSVSEPTVKERGSLQKMPTSLEGQLKHMKTGEWFEVQSRVFSIEPLLSTTPMIAYCCSDLRAQKKIEKALSESAERLKLALRAGKMGCWDQDIPGKIFWPEGTATTIFGRPEGMFQGTFEEFAECLVPQDVEVVRNAQRVAFENGGDFQVEFRTIWLDGSIHWISARGQAFFDEQGKPIRLTGVGADITDKKYIEEMLREREAQLYSLLEENPVGIVLNDAEGNIKIANEAFLHLFGYTKEDLRTGRVNWHHLHANENAAMLLTSSEIYMGSQAQPEEIIYEKEYFRKDGRRIPVRIEISKLRSAKQGSIGFVVDLTERKQAQEESARNRLLFQRIAEATPDIIYVYDLCKRRNLYVNRAGQHILGDPITMDTIEGSADYSLIHPDDVERMAESYKRFEALEDFEVVEIEYRMRNAEGNYIWLRNRAVVFSRASDGKPEQILGIIQDITEHKKSNEALKRSEERERARAQELEILMNSVPACVWISHDKESRRITGNSAAYELLRMEPGTNQSKSAPAGECPPHFRVMRDGKEIPCKELPLQKAAAEGIEIRGFEMDVVFDDGRCHRLFGNVTPIFNSEGIQQGAVGIFVDSTEKLLAEQALRLSEERFRSLVAATAAVVWTADAKGNFVTPQLSWEMFTGQNFKEQQNLGWLSMFLEEDQAKIKARFDQAMEERSLYEIEGRLFRAKDSQYRYVFIRAVPLLSGDGYVREWVGTITDMHEIKRVEEERLALLEQEQKARAEAERTNRMKDEFLATVSHELRTPLTAIMGWVHMLRTDSGDPTTFSTAVETIERNARSQAQLIEDILDVSRIITGKLRLKISKVKCDEVVQAALDALKPALQSKEITVHGRIDSEIDPIDADAGRLQQIVWNLLSNAVKFTPRGGDVFVEVKEEKKQVCIQVKDTGEGIPSDFLPYVFDRFRQADGTITRKHSGLGLGLSIVRHLVELHGGKIVAESEGKGKGATFIVTLPKSEKSKKSISRTALPEKHISMMVESSIDPSVRLDGSSILIVDDAPDILSMLQALLKSCGATVQAATSAKEAYEHLKHVPFDVIVSDLAMPEEDGYTFIRKVRSLFSDKQSRIPAIALTAHVRVEDRVRALAAGFQMFVAKPIEPNEIISVIADVIDSQKRRLRNQKSAEEKAKASA